MNIPPTVAPRQNDPVLARLNAEAERLGESLVPAVPTPTRSSETTTTSYKAEPGDTLSKIAQKAYGSSAKAYRDAIVEANPSLKANPDLVIEGRTYVIPAIRPDAATVATTPTASTTQKPAPASEAIYVVVEGDNLTRIATRELGTPEAVAAIKELNRDLLKGSDLIRPGMKLRLPAKVAMN